LQISIGLHAIFWVSKLLIPKLVIASKILLIYKNKLHLHCCDIGDISVLTISLEMSAVIISKDYCSTPCYVTHYTVCMSGLMLIFALAMV